MRSSTRTARMYPIGITLLAAAGCMVLSVTPPPVEGEGTASPRLRTVEPVAITFEPNVGHVSSDVDFVARSPRHTVLLTAGGMTTESSVPEGERLVVTRMKLVGSDSGAESEAIGPSGRQSHYFIGNDPAGWRTGVRHYNKVRYADVYQGIDLVYYSRDGELEYDFVVEPGADPSQVELEFEGPSRVHLASNGDLVLAGPMGEARHTKPFVYQEIAGDRREVAGHYETRGEDRVGFKLGPYDQDLPLVMDPKLQVSSFTGGAAQDFTQTLAYGPNNALWVSGASQSTNFPIPSGAIRPLRPGLRATFLARYDEVVDADGRWTRRLGSTIFIGGSRDTTPKKLRVDDDGILYLLGDTDSTDFPTTNGAFQTFYGGGARDMFVSIIDPGGSGGTLSLVEKGDGEPVLLSSTLVGGTGDDFGEDADLGDCPKDLPGPCFFWAGNTTSTNLNPTANAPQHPFGGKEDGLIGITAPDPTPADAELAFLMRFGGSGSEVDQRIAATVGGGFCLGMTTDSTTLPVPGEALEGSVQPEPAGGTDGFITCLKPLAEKSLNTAGLDEEDFSQEHDAATFSGGDNDDRLADLDAPVVLTGVMLLAVRAAFNSESAGLFGETPDLVNPPGAAPLSPNDPGHRIVRFSDSLDELFWAEEVNHPGDDDLAHLDELFDSEPRLDLNFARPEVRYDWSTSGPIGERNVRLAVTSDSGQEIITIFLSPEDRTGEPVSTYSSVLLGGEGDEVVTDGEIGPASAAAVGFTNSTSASTVGLGAALSSKGGTPGFPVTPGAPQRQFGGGSFDGFLIEFYQPQLLRQAVLGGASFLERDVTGGQILTLFAFSVGAPAGIGLALDDQGLVAEQLGLTRVLFDGQPSPMVFANRNQVSVIAPVRIQTQERTLMQVEFDGVVSNTVELPVASSAPGLFSLAGTGAGQGAILNPDFSVNGVGNPSPGDSFIVLYGTGGGATDLPCPDGEFGPSDEPLPRLQLPQRVLLDGVEAQVPYGGSAPGLVCGVNQWNVVPTNNPTGIVSVQVCSGDICSNEVTAVFE